jgi:lysophospholipase L1-like esterase
VLGNSLIAGTGVGNEGQFTTLLQQQLGTSKILNFGLHGGGTEQQLLIYRRFVAPLRPKIVVSALWPIYEIDNAIKFRHWQQDREHRDFIRNMAPDPAVDRHLDPRALVREAAEHFALVHALHQKSKELRGIQDPVQSVVVNNGKTLFLSSADQHWLELGCRRPGMPDACTALVEPLSQLKSEVEVNGGALLVVLVPSKEELYASDRLPDVLRTEREIRMALAKRKIPTLNLYPAFSTFARSRPEFYALDPHLNAFGHQLVSKALADAIQSRLGATQQGVIVSPRMSIGMRATSAKLVLPPTEN